MRRLMVQIEVNGTCKYVGDITEKDFGKAYFTYADEYLSDSGSRPISISLPLDEKTFDAVRTKKYFDGLLPEGFTRRCVAEWMHTEEKDYLSILSGLGRECLGAIMALKFETAIKTAQAELEENGFLGTDVILGQILKKGGIKNFISH